MNQENLSVSSEQTLKLEQGVRRSFLRLYEDFMEVMTDAVDHAMAQGLSKAEVARRMNVDPAFLTRVTQGQAGTNLRTIGALLYATDCRVKISLVSCAELKADRYSASKKLEVRFKEKSRKVWSVSQSAVSADEVVSFDTQHAKFREMEL